MRKAALAPLLILLLLLPVALAAPPGGPEPHEANMTLAKFVNRSRAQVGDVLRYTIYFNNTGNLQAQMVWINDTLPTGTAYLSDSAATAGGTPNGPFRWTFSNVPAFSSRSFFLNVTVLHNATPGTELRNRVTLDYLNSVGVKQPGLAAVSGPTLFGIKVKTLHFREDPLFEFLFGPSTDPTNTLAPSLNRNCNPTGPPFPANQCNYDGDALHGITVRRGQNLSIPSQFHEWILNPAMNNYFHFQGTAAVRLWVDDNGIGASESVMIYLWEWDGVTLNWITGPISSTRTLDTSPGFQPWDMLVSIPDYTVRPGSLILVVLTVPMISSNDLQFAYDSISFPSGVSMETNTYISIPYMAIEENGSAETLFSYGERVDIIAAVVDPFGTYDIVDAFTYVNITDPTGSQVRAYEPMIFLGDSGTYKVFYYSYVIPQGATQGVYTVRVTSYETNLVFVYNITTFEVRMPVMSFAKVASSLMVRSGATFTYSIYFNNTGTSAARILWVNDTLPAQVAMVSNNASSSGGVALGPTSWRFTNVTPGSHFFTITATLSLTAAAGSVHTDTVVFNHTDTKYQWLPGAQRQVNITAVAPHINLVVVPVLSLVRDGQTWVVRAYFNNTGNEAAPKVWINFTHGSNGSFVGDDAGVQGYDYSRTTGIGTVNFELRNVGVGSHALNLTFRMVAGLPGGAGLRVDATLAYRNGGGIPMGGSTGQHQAYLNEPLMLLQLSRNPSIADPGTVVAFSLRYDNTGVYTSAARSTGLFLNFTATWTLRDASSGSTYNATARSLSWNQGQVNPGGVGWVYANLTLSTSVADAVVETVRGRATFNNDANTPRPHTYSNATVTSRAPILALAVVHSATVVLNGDQITYTLYHNNSGTGSARNAWINSTLAAGTRFVSTSAPGAVAYNSTNNVLSIRIPDVAPGNRLFNVVVRVASSFQDNGTLTNTFRLEYQDNNGNFRGSGLRTVASTQRSPVVTVTLTADTSTPGPADVLRYNVTVRNGGGAASQDLWVNLSLSPHLEYLSDGAPVLVAGSGGNYSWHLTNLGAGGTTSWVVVVQVRSTAPDGRIIPELVVVDYSEARGVPFAQVKSSSVSITVTYPPGPPPSSTFLGLDSFMLLLLLLAGVVAAGGAGAALHHRHRAAIEEVFVIYRDGSLLAHRSKTLTPDKDEDVLAGMFTAVQQFINDSFAYGQTRELKHMNMGEYSVDIERGKYIYLAVVYRGKGAKAFTNRLVKAVADLETEFQPVLQDWGGNMEQLKGVKERLRSLLKG